MNGELKVGTLVQCLDGTPNLAHRKFAGTIHVIAAVSTKATVGGLVSHHLDPPTVVGFSELLWTRRYLRILGNPSDDEVDQTLLWKTVPKSDEVMA